MSGFQSKVTRGSIANGFSNGIRVVITFLQAILVAKWLGVEGYGQVSLIIGYTTFLHYLFMLGFDHTLPIFLASSSEQSKEKPRQVLFRSVNISLVAAFVVLILGGVATYILTNGTSKEDLFIPGLIMAIQMEFSALGYILGSYFRSFKLFNESIIREQLVFPLTSLGGMFIFIYCFEMGVLGYALGFLSAAVAALLYMVLTIHRVKPPKEKKEPATAPILGWKNQLLFSLPVGLMATLEPIFYYTPQMVSGWQLSVGEVGYIGVCSRLGFFMTLALLAINPIFTPFMATFKQEQNLEEFKNLYQKVIFWCLSWALLSSFVFAMFSPEILSVFGRGFIPASGVLLAMLPGLFFEGAFGATKLSLVMAGHNMVNMYNLVVATVFNGVAIYLGNHYFGVIGGAAAFSITMIFLNLLRLAQLNILYKILPIGRHKIAPVLGAFILCGICLFWNFNQQPGLIPRLIFGFAACCALALLLTWSEREMILKRIRR